MTWDEHQQWEANWWNCANTFGEEEKQFTYAEKMQLSTFHDGKSPYNFDMKGQSVVDIGGGPVSLLLKCTNLTRGVVVDPCKYPQWIADRYQSVGIEYQRVKAEEFITNAVFDLCLIYNVLQHVVDPAKVINTCRQISKVIRIFEWLDIHQSPGHPHVLRENDLNNWLGGRGKVEVLTQPTLNGRCYYGVFKGEHF